MNILMINKFYFNRGGTERYFFDLKKLLEKKGYTVIPFAMKHGKNLSTKYSKYFVSEIKTQPSWNIYQNFKTIFRFWWSLEAQRKIKRLIEENIIDIAHIHNIYHQISPSILPVLKKNNIPIIMTVHDYALISSRYNLYKSKKMNTKFVHNFICLIERFLHHKVLNVYRKNIDVYICPSEFVKNKLIQGGFDKNKIKVVPHFVIYPSGLRSTQTTSPYKGEDKYILYFGRLSEEKGIQVLINAMKELPKLKLKIVGQGYFEPNLKFQVSKLKLKNVKFLGFKNQTELQKIILNSEFVVVPSLAPEAFGLSALEAMALGKVVLASKIGALPELISNEFLFKPGDVKELVTKIKGLVPYLLKKGEGLTKRPEYAKIKGYENQVKVKQKYGQNEHFQQIWTIYRKFIKQR